MRQQPCHSGTVRNERSVLRLNGKIADVLIPQPVRLLSHITNRPDSTFAPLSAIPDCALAFSAKTVMKLKLDIRPDIATLLQAEVAAGEKAVSAAMREAGTSLKSAWRGQITGAGLGTRLGNSIRLASFPKSSDSLNAAALVWSNAPVIIGAHDTGPLIRSRNGFWLAIPTPAAGKS
ncbi:hypothetical protein ABIE69_003319, partial [Rhodobacteraceae bacterium MBR-64]